jgi:hypothetical protein
MVEPIGDVRARQHLACSTDAPVARMRSEDFPRFLPFHRVMLHTLVSLSHQCSADAADETGAPVVVDGDKSADDDDEDQSHERDEMWNLIDCFLVERVSLLHARRESMIAGSVHDRAAATWLVRDDDDNDVQAKTNNNDAACSSPVGTGTDPVKRKRGSYQASGQKKRRSTTSNFDEQEPTSVRVSRMSQAGGGELSDDETPASSSNNPMHVIVRFLGRRKTVASSRFDTQTARYESVRSYVKSRKGDLRVRLAALESAMREENQLYVQNLLAFDLYKIKPSSPPRVPDREGQILKLSEVERLRTELTLWTMLDQDMEHVLGDNDNKTQQP